MERLRRISYRDMIGFLKQSNLSDIASIGAGGTGLIRSDPNQRLANVVDAADEVMTEQIPDAYAVSSGFLQAGVMTVGAEPSAEASTSKRAGKRRGARRGNRGPSSTSAQASTSYTPVTCPPAKEMSAAFTVGLAVADQVMGPELCQNPLPLLAAVIGVLSATEEDKA